MSNWNHLKPNDCKIVIIEWADITEYGQWGEEEAVQTTDVVTVGWLLEDNDRWTVIAGTYSYTDDAWATVCIFPKKDPEIEVIREARSEQCAN